MTHESRTRSCRTERPRPRCVVALMVAWCCGTVQAHEPWADALPPAPGWRLGAAVALVAPGADERWPQAQWPGVLITGSAARDQRGGARVEHATLDLAARLNQALAAQLAMGWHDRDSSHVEAARVLARWAVGADELEAGLGRDTVPFGEPIDGAGHFDRFSQPPLAKRAVLNDQWIDDGISLAWRGSVEDGVRAVQVGVWRGNTFPGGPRSPAVPSLHVHVGWGHVDAHLTAAHLEPQGRGAALQSAGARGHVHGSLDCRSSLQQRVCFDGRVDVLGASVQWEPEAGDWTFVLAGLARRERGALYSLSGDADYRGSTSGLWADAAWRPAPRWTLAGRAERLVPDSRVDGIGATLLAREAGLESGAPVERLTLGLAHEVTAGLEAGLEAGAERSAAGRVSFVALRLVWRGPGWLAGDW